MSEDRIPYEPQPDRVVVPIRRAIERHVAKQNERDRQRQPEPPEAA